MTKKIMLFSLVVLLILSSFKFTSYGEIQDIALVKINNKNHELSKMMIEGSFYVPMRYFFENVGAKVNWEQDTQTAIATKGKKTIRFQKDNSVISINNDYYLIEGSVRIINNMTYIPLRAAAESLDYGVKWSKDIIEIGANIKPDRKSLVHTSSTISTIKEIPILIYHSFSNDLKALNSVVVSPDKFRKDLLALKAAGYNTILPWELKAHLDGNYKLPDKPIMITFDDGYRDNYTLAYPILKELNMKATIFVIGWSVGRETRLDNVTPIIPHFSWEEAKEMSESGLVSIQPHSYNLHENDGQTKGVEKYPNESEKDYIKRFKEDTDKITHLIKEKVGEDTVIFCYPYGSYNATTERVLSDMNIYSVTTESGVASLKKNGMALNRINVPAYLSQKDLLDLID